MALYYVVDSNKIKAFELNVAATLLELAKLHRANAIVVRTVAMALYNISTHGTHQCNPKLFAQFQEVIVAVITCFAMFSDGNKAAAIKHGAREFARAALRDFPDPAAGVQQEAKDLLDALSLRRL